jgi:hypothetical protein
VDRSDPPLTHSRRRPHSRRRLVWLAGLAAAATALYAGVAYFVLPTLWRHYEHEPGLARRPMVTVTIDGIPGDPLNVGLVGSQDEAIDAMRKAGWNPADAVTLRSGVEIAESVLLDRPYIDAPVSPLFYEGRRQDLAFEKPAGRSADRRHHVRFWRILDAGRLGRPVWLGAATFDSSVGLSRYTGEITHHIGPDIDAERDGLIADLEAAGILSEVYQVSGTGPTLAGRNGGGDPYFTDGEITIGAVTRSDERATSARRLGSPAAVEAKNAAWGIAKPLFRAAIRR